MQPTGPRLNIRKDSTAAEVPVKFRSDRTILNTNLAASRLYKILRKDVFSDIETGSRVAVRRAACQLNTASGLECRATGHPRYKLGLGLLGIYKARFYNHPDDFLRPSVLRQVLA